MKLHLCNPASLSIVTSHVGLHNLVNSGELGIWILYITGSNIENTSSKDDQLFSLNISQRINVGDLGEAMQ